MSSNLIADYGINNMLSNFEVFIILLKILYDESIPLVATVKIISPFAPFSLPYPFPPDTGIIYQLYDGLHFSFYCVNLTNQIGAQE